MLARGAEKTEVIESIEKGQWEPAKENKQHSTSTFLFENISPVNNQFYKFKTVDSVFVQENSEIIVVTVKVYYHNEQEEK
ncbi:MAG: hypothetical protein HW421_2909 [Ignavibacteria bacterium]|nr:hypothetical protein [Ignavibacteria bacterium]